MLSKAQLRRLLDFQTLIPSERLRFMFEAMEQHLRQHPEIARARERAIKAGNIHWRPKNRWELELIRDERGRKRLQVVEVPYEKTGEAVHCPPRQS